MEKFQLSVLFKIIGIGSASGLVYQNDLLYVISDNSTYLYEYNIPAENLNRINLVDNAQENIAKNDKPDFEAITYKGKDIVVLGSGSTQNRNQAILYNTSSKKVKQKNFGGIYQQMKTQLSITDSELNIEGLAITADTIYFFNRGNGANSKNGIIYGADSENPDFRFVPFDLPKINNIPTTFTDALLVDGKIYFLASAENTASTYDDGEILGSIIGKIDLKTMKLEKTLQVSGKHKFEGLTLYSKTETQIEFLLCEDADSELLETSIYKLVITD
ncbi:MAG: hypothetical protein QM710_02545 [Flavobacterium sp.]